MGDKNKIPLQTGISYSQQLLEILSPSCDKAAIAGRWLAEDLSALSAPNRAQLR
jgi:hypothetical protein